MRYHRNCPFGSKLHLMPGSSRGGSEDLRVPMTGPNTPTFFLSSVTATALVLIAYGIAKACGATLIGREMAALIASGALLVATGVPAFAPRFRIKPFLWALAAACAFTGVCWVVFMATSHGLFLVGGFVMMLAAVLAGLFKDADTAVGFHALVGSLLFQICVITLVLKP